MSYHPNQWRLIISPPASGAWNMALDEALLETAGQGLSAPTLRLYAWKPACLSLGFAQPIADVNFAELRKRGWGLVRRPTGGRAILHVDELTYAITGPYDEPRFKGSILESYHTLAQGLSATLLNLGVSAQPIEKPDPTQNLTSRDNHNGYLSNSPNPVCFEVHSSYEITVSGKKIIGSAQRRSKEGVLQHGSLPLKGDLRRIIWVLNLSDERSKEGPEERLLARATTLASTLGRRISWKEAARAFINAFESTFNLELLPDQPTKHEIRRASVLVEEKYANRNWTQRV